MRMMTGRIRDFLLSNMRLILLGFFILLFLLSVSGYLIHMIQVRFDELERNRNLEHAKGVVLVINRDANSLSHLLAGWAYWEETFLFLTGENPRYFKEYFTLPVMRETGIDMVVIFDLNDRYVYSRRLEMDRSTSGEIPGEVVEKIRQALPDLIPAKIDGFKWGLLETDQGVMILTCRHVSDDRITRPSQGYILFGRLLDRKELQKISDIQGNSLMWAAESSKSKIKEGLIDVPDFGQLPVYRSLSGSRKTPDMTQTIRVVLPDILGEPSLFLSIDVPGNYSEQAQATARLINQVNIVTILIISAFVFYLILEIHRRQKAESHLRESLGFERAVSRLSQIFINLSEDHLDEAINESLAILAGCIPSDFGYIFEFSDEDGRLCKTHHWHSERYTPQLAFYENIPTGGLEDFIAKMKKGEAVVLSFEKDIAANSRVAAYVPGQLRSGSSLNAPMKEGDKLIGFIGFANMDGQHVWSDAETRLLSTFAGILTLSIQRKKAQIKIRESEKTLMESALKDSELKSLKAQINPHFLFNSLNSLRALIDENPGNARRAVTLLSNLLRAALRAGNEELIRLEEEMVVVNAFVSLEQIRFEERLRVMIHVPTECLPCRVPPMLVQTLVENAVKYGVEPYSNGGLISIKALIRDEKLHLTVENTGQLAENSESSQIGLMNAQERIRLIFNDRGQLRIFNSSSTTVTAEIILPATYERSLGR
ncbi:histidine kinase [Oscillatoria amoena NRMC-F 0135]|nr:histidine kinase [Oscillatoria amoena NRMC-F 0135]